MRTVLRQILLFKRTLVQQVARLFSQGEQGVWYDPSDFSTLFQDSAGTTPVTAVEQPVGLMLDSRYGLVRGGELWADASTTFFGESSKVSTGVYRIYSSAGALSYVTIASGFTIGKTYEVVFTVDSISAVGSNIQVEWTGAPLITTTGAKQMRLVASATSIIIKRTTNPCDIQISAVSVRELAGNHATQATSASRPVLSARVNLLTYSEDFSNAAWTQSGVTVTTNSTVAPDGTLTADALYETSASGSHRVTQNAVAPANTNCKVSVSLKPNGRTWAIVVLGGGGNGYYFDLSNLVVGSETGGAGTVSSPQISLENNGWVRVSLNFIASDSRGIEVFTSTGNGQFSFTGDTTKGVYVWGAQLETGSTATRYQSITTATSYDTVGFPKYLKFDGIGDSLATAAINFTSTDKMTVFAGVRKLSDAAAAVLCELSASISTSSGAATLFAPDGAAPRYLFSSKGTGQSSASATGYTAPLSSVLTGVADIAADVATLRINGAQAATSGTDQGTGNFGNYPLYIGRRGGTSLPFNGHLYSLIVRGAQSSDSQIVSAESYVNSKTGAY